MFCLLERREKVRDNKLLKVLAILCNLERLMGRGDLKMKTKRDKKTYKELNPNQGGGGGNNTNNPIKLHRSRPLFILGIK